MVPEFWNVISTLVGGGVVILSNIIMENIRKKNNELGIASAYYGEVYGLISAMVDSEILDHITIKLIINNKERICGSDLYIAPRARYYVMEKNSVSLGILKYPVPMKLSEFYCTYETLYDYIELARKEINEGKILSDELSGIYNNIVEGIETAFYKGKASLKEIEKQYSFSNEEVYGSAIKRMEGRIELRRMVYSTEHEKFFKEVVCEENITENTQLE